MDIQRTLHLNYQDGHSRLSVTDSDQQTVLYTVIRSSSKPQLPILRAATPYAAGFIIGKVTLHTWSSAIDLEIPGPLLAMQKTSKLSSNYDVHGNNINWRWERDRALTSDIRLVDYTGGGVASEV